MHSKFIILYTCFFDGGSRKWIEQKIGVNISEISEIWESNYRTDKICSEVLLENGSKYTILESFDNLIKKLNDF